MCVCVFSSGHLWSTGDPLDDAQGPLTDAVGSLADTGSPLVNFGGPLADTEACLVDTGGLPVYINRYTSDCHKRPNGW